jgi:hypothetical protein
MTTTTKTAANIGRIKEDLMQLSDVRFPKVWVIAENDREQVAKELAMLGQAIEHFRTRVGEVMFEVDPLPF